MTTLAPWLRDAPALLAWLRGYDLKFGTGEALRATALLDHLGAGGQGPPSPHEAARWLAPVLCINADEVARLREALSRYAAEWRESEPISIAVPDSSPPAPSAADLRNVAALEQAASRARWMLPAAVGVAVIVAIALSVLYWTGPLPTLTGGASAGAATSAGLSLSGAFAWAARWLPDLAALRFTLVPWIGWLLFRHYYHRRRALLRRGQGVDGQQRHLPIAAERHTLFLQARLRRPLQTLRRHRLVEVNSIDVARSLGATIAAAGRPRLVRAHQPRRPDYPVLVEQLAGNDHLSALGRAILARLQEEQVAATGYVFESDPRRVRDLHGAGASLDDLAYRHSPDTLILVSDGACLLDPLTGRARPWVTELADRPFAVLLTPVPLRRWSMREQRLAEAGLVVLPATTGGLEHLAAFIERGGEPPQPALQRSPVRPSVIMRVGRREIAWHQDWPVPAPEERERLLDALRAELLKPAFDLLCLIAIFPEVRLDLTLHLGRVLKRRDGSDLLDEASFAEIAWLPWLRFGRLPDWLRRDLILCLTPSRLSDARSVFEKWLVKDQASPPGAEIELTLEARKYLRQRLRNEAAQDTSNRLRDAIFLRFMSNKPIDELDLDAPNALARELQSGWLSADRVALYGTFILSLFFLLFGHVISRNLGLIENNSIVRYSVYFFSLLGVIMLLSWHLPLLGRPRQLWVKSATDPSWLGAVIALGIVLMSYDTSGLVFCIPIATAVLSVCLTPLTSLPMIPSTPVQTQDIVWFLISVMLVPCLIALTINIDNGNWLPYPILLCGILSFLTLNCRRMAPLMLLFTSLYFICVAQLIGLFFTIVSITGLPESGDVITTAICTFSVMMLAHVWALFTATTKGCPVLRSVCAATGGAVIVLLLCMLWYKSYSNGISRSIAISVVSTYLLLLGCILIPPNTVWSKMHIIFIVAFALIMITLGLLITKVDIQALFNFLLGAQLSARTVEAISSAVTLGAQIALVPAGTSIIVNRSTTMYMLVMNGARPYKSLPWVLAHLVGVVFWPLGLSIHITEEIVVSLPLLYLSLAAWLGTIKSGYFCSLAVLVFSLLPLLIGLSSLGPVSTNPDLGRAVIALTLFLLVRDRLFRSKVLLADLIHRRDSLFLLICMGMSVTWGENRLVFGGDLLPALYFVLFMLGASRVPRLPVVRATMIAGVVGTLLAFLPPSTLSGFQVRYAFDHVGRIATGLICYGAGMLWARGVLGFVRTIGLVPLRGLLVAVVVVVSIALALLPHLQWQWQFAPSGGESSFVTATVLQPLFFLLGFAFGPTALIVAGAGVAVGELIPSALLNGSAFSAGGPTLAAGPITIAVQFASAVQILVDRLDDFSLVLLGWRMAVAVRRHDPEQETFDAEPDLRRVAA